MTRLHVKILWSVLYDYHHYITTRTRVQSESDECAGLSLIVMIGCMVQYVTVSAKTRLVRTIN